MAKDKQAKLKNLSQKVIGIIEDTISEYEEFLKEDIKKDIKDKKEELVNDIENSDLERNSIEELLIAWAKDFKELEDKYNEEIDEEEIVSLTDLIVSYINENYSSNKLEILKGLDTKSLQQQIQNLTIQLKDSETSKQYYKEKYEILLQSPVTISKE